MRARSLEIAALALTLWAAASVAPAYAQSSLSFVEPDALTLTIPTGKSTTVWLSNDGPAVVDLEWSLQLQKGDEAPFVLPEAAATKPPQAQNLQVAGVAGEPGIAANATAPFRLRLKGLEDGSYTGQLVARVEGAEPGAPGVGPATLDAEVSPARNFAPSLNWMLAAPFILALLFAVAKAFNLRKSWGRAVGTLDLDFSESFATTLTTVGALLTIILAAGLLPEETAGLSKEAFQGLSLVFGVLILIAPLIYTATVRRLEVKVLKDPDDPKSAGPAEIHYEGRVSALLAASLITMWAVFGQLLTIYRLLGDVEPGNDLTAGALYVIYVILAVGALLMLVYAWRKLTWIVKETSEEALGVTTGATLTTPPPPLTRVSVL